MTWFKDAFQMIRDLRSESPWVGRWGFMLNMPMWVGGLLFAPRPVALAVFGLNTAAVLIAGQIHKRNEFSRFTSVCHVAWLPVLVPLAGALQNAAEPAYFRAWVGYTLVTMAISLVLDVRNLYLHWFTDNRTLSQRAAEVS